MGRPLTLSEIVDRLAAPSSAGRRGLQPRRRYRPRRRTGSLTSALPGDPDFDRDFDTSALRPIANVDRTVLQNRERALRMLAENPNMPSKAREELERIVRGEAQEKSGGILGSLGRVLEPLDRLRRVVAAGITDLFFDASANPELEGEIKAGDYWDILMGRHEKVLERVGPEVAGEHGDFSASHMLTRLGWELDDDSGFWEKAARWVLATAGDLATDPLTYMSQGLSAFGRTQSIENVARTTARAAKEAFEGATRKTVGRRVVRQAQPAAAFDEAIHRSLRQARGRHLQRLAAEEVEKANARAVAGRLPLPELTVEQAARMPHVRRAAQVAATGEIASPVMTAIARRDFGNLPQYWIDYSGAPSYLKGGIRVGVNPFKPQGGLVLPGTRGLKRQALSLGGRMPRMAQPLKGLVDVSPSLRRWIDGVRVRFGADLPFIKFAEDGLGWQAWAAKQDAVKLMKQLDNSANLPALENSLLAVAARMGEAGVDEQDAGKVLRSMLSWVQEGFGRKGGAIPNVTGQVLGRTIDEVDEAIGLFAQMTRRTLDEVFRFAQDIDPSIGQIVDYVPQLATPEFRQAAQLINEGKVSIAVDSKGGGLLSQLVEAHANAIRTGGAAGTAPHFLTREFGATAELAPIAIEGDMILFSPDWMRATGLTLDQLNTQMQSALEDAFTRAGLNLPKPRKGEVFQIFDTRPDVVLNNYFETMKAALFQRAMVREWHKYSGIATKTKSVPQIQHTLNAIATTHADHLGRQTAQMLAYAQERVKDLAERPWKMEVLQIGPHKIAVPETVAQSRWVREATRKAHAAVRSAERKGLASQKAWELRVASAKAKFGVSDEVASMFAAMETPEALDELAAAITYAAKEAAVDLRASIDVIDALEDITPAIKAGLKQAENNMMQEVAAADAAVRKLFDDWRAQAQWAGARQIRELSTQDAADLAAMIEDQMTHLIDLRRAAAEAAAQGGLIRAERLDAAAKGISDAADPYAYAARQRAVIREDGEQLFQLHSMIDEASEFFDDAEAAQLLGTRSVYDDLFDNPEVRDKFADWWQSLGGNRTRQSGRRRWEKLVANARRRVEDAEARVQIRSDDMDVVAALRRGFIREAATRVDGLNRIAADIGLPGEFRIYQAYGEWKIVHEWGDTPRKLTLTQAAKQVDEGADPRTLGLLPDQEELLWQFQQIRDNITRNQGRFADEVGEELSPAQLAGYRAWVEVEDTLRRVADGTLNPKKLRRLLRFTRDGRLVQTDTYKALKAVLDAPHLAALNRISEALMSADVFKPTVHMRRQMTAAATASIRADEAVKAVERVGVEVADALRLSQANVVADDVVRVGLFLEKLRDLQRKWGPNTGGFDVADVHQLAIDEAEGFLKELAEVKEFWVKASETDVAKAVMTSRERKAVRSVLNAQRVAISPPGGMVRPTVFGTQADFLANQAFHPMATVLLENASNTYKAMYHPQFIQTMMAHGRAMMRYWKGAATVQRPNFHIRNMMGIVFNNIIGGATPAQIALVGPYTARFRRVLNESGDIAKALATIPNARVRDIFEQAWKTDVFNKSFAVAEFRGVLHGKRPRMNLNPASPDFILNRAGGKAMEQIEDLGRLAVFAKWYDPALEGSEYVAAQTAIALHFDYTDLTRAERMIKSIIPFFVWTRRNIPLQLRVLMERPGIANAYTRFMEEGNQQFGTTPMDGMPLSKWWGADAVGTDIIFNKDTPWWARVIFDPDLPITDLTELPLSLAPSDWFNYLADNVSPLASVPVTMIEQEDFPDANSPLGLGLVTRLLAEAGLWGTVTTGGDVQIDRLWITAWNTLFPQANDITPLLAPFLPGLLDPPNPNRRQNLGFTDDPDFAERIRTALLSLGRGVGIKLQTPATIVQPAFEDRELMTQITNMLQRTGSIPPPD